MTRNQKYIFLYQILSNSLWALTLVSTGLITILILMDLPEPKDDRRPRFNLKEI